MTESKQTNNSPPLSNTETSGSNFIVLTLSQCPSRTILERLSWDGLVAVCREDMFGLRDWE